MKMGCDEDGCDEDGCCEDGYIEMETRCVCPWVGPIIVACVSPSCTCGLARALLVLVVIPASVCVNTFSQQSLSEVLSPVLGCPVPSHRPVLYTDQAANLGRNTLQNCGWHIIKNNIIGSCAWHDSKGMGTVLSGLSVMVIT